MTAGSQSIWCGLFEDRRPQDVAFGVQLHRFGFKFADPRPQPADLLLRGFGQARRRRRMAALADRDAGGFEPVAGALGVAPSCGQTLGGVDGGRIAQCDVLGEVVCGQGDDEPAA